MSESFGTMEYESLEQKYVELKTKLKRTLQINEKYSVQIQKLNKRMKLLENENSQLENQIQHYQSSFHESESEVSSSDRPRQDETNMTNLVHLKNVQISDLLKDIEEVEKENMVLREKLADAKDQLSSATTEISLMTETLKAKDVIIQEHLDLTKEMSVSIENLKEEIKLCNNEKNEIEKNLETFSLQVNKKVDKWKELLDKKNADIAQLKSENSKRILKSPPSSSDDHEDVNDSYISTLKMALCKAETKLTELKTEMEKYTQDLKDSTEVVNKLKMENDTLKIRITEMGKNEKEIKIQLDKSHNRCQNLQEEVKFSSRLTKVLETDLSKLKTELKENGQTDLVKNFEEYESLKIQNLLYQKQIVGLIKDINQLQEMCNVFKLENASLRHQLGIKPEDSVHIDSKFLSEKEKKERLIENLNLDIKNEREVKIRLKMEIKELNKKIAALTNKILVKEPSTKKYNQDQSNNVAPSEENEALKNNVALSEENEALRKGLHEILNRIQETNETSPRELKSDVLERLLKALDAKHISGWYHPAMRLQAELHTLEGVNSELREQLHEARSERDKLKILIERKDINEVGEKDLDHIRQDSEVKDYKEKNLGIKELLNSKSKSLQGIKVQVLKIINDLNESNTNVEETLQHEFELLQNNMELLHKECNHEKQQLLKKIDTQNQLQTEMLEESTHKNKNVWPLQKNHELEEEISKLKYNSIKVEQNQSLFVEGLLKKIIHLQSKLRLKENFEVNSVSTQQFKEVQNSLNDHIIKYRKLLKDIEEQNKCQLLEIEILKQKEEDLTKENTDLKAKLNQLLCNKHQDRYKQETNSPSFSEKLADMEIQALSEKQRADHTNNLYELVKEQLRKSEENFSEFSKYGENLVQKNLILQERVVDLEDKITFCVDPDLYKELEKNLNSLLDDKEKLISENASLMQKCQENLEPSKWNNEKEQELLALKHQIVDLTATSDEKLLIAQLNSDLAKSRSEERESELKIDFLKNEVSLWESRYKELSVNFDRERNKFDLEINRATKKICVLQNLILKQRIQYHGFVPLIGQEILAEKLHTVNKERHNLFIALQNVKALENKLQISLEYQSTSSDRNSAILTQQDNLWTHNSDRQYEFKEQQIKYLLQKIEGQDVQLEKLEQELLRAYGDFDLNVVNDKKVVRNPVLVKQIVSQESLDPQKNEAQIRVLRNVESQTEPNLIFPKEDEISLLKIKVSNFEKEISLQRQQNMETNNLLIKKDSEIRTVKNQLEEKIREVAMLETKLMELKQHTDKRSERQDNGAAGDGISMRSRFLDEEIVALRTGIKSLKEKLSQKDKEIIKYQTLLKEDRDKHSLAAANLHQELISVQKSLASLQQKNNSLEEAIAISRQKSAMMEKYVSQVRALEQHLAELHTHQTKIESQLRAAQDEANRWRQMAQERLVAMQELGKSLNEQHKKELTSYKTDYEKLKELSEDEVPKQKIVGKSGVKLTGYVDPDVLKLCREKDAKIKELYSKLSQFENSEKTEINLSVTDKEKANMEKEIEVLKKRYELLVTKEKNARYEIKDLKEQLLKRNTYSTQSKQSEKSIKEQLQRKINQLENEIDVLKEKLNQEMILNEKHKQSANEDFQKWKKQKYWQENCEKYKNKLLEKEEELQKLQQISTGYRMLIERLEREKINLENRIKSLKSNPRGAIADQEIELLKSENSRLAGDLATLQAKMEMRQQGAGVLGAALMQEKLEAQERKIAVLELSAKGTVEVRNELERLQTSLSNLQKSNLCLEAENLELKMDLEKYSKETPHLQEQLQHLENYIELLKNENQSTECLTTNVEDKKVSQLERTVFILKRVVEKLQVENKRLHSGKRPLSERSSSAEKLKRDYVRLKEQHTENLQKMKELESKLIAANKRVKILEKNPTGNVKVEQLQMQLEQVREQLANKTLLLDKVKALLHGAAAREKQLLKEVSELRNQSSKDKDLKTVYPVEIPSPIEEVSEENSDI